VAEFINPERKPNRLINEKSPYLLQHAHNPVDGTPGARRRSRRLGKRISRCFSVSAKRLPLARCYHGRSRLPGKGSHQTRGAETGRGS